jgi:hypothetical protein
MLGITRVPFVLSFCAFMLILKYFDVSLPVLAVIVIVWIGIEITVPGILRSIAHNLTRSSQASVHQGRGAH